MFSQYSIFVSLLCSLAFMSCQQAGNQLANHEGTMVWDMGPDVQIATVSRGVTEMPVREQQVVLANLRMMHTEMRNAGLESIHLMTEVEVASRMSRYPHHLPHPSDQVDNAFEDFILPVANAGKALASDEAYEYLNKILGLWKANAAFKSRMIVKLDASSLYFTATANASIGIIDLKSCLEDRNNPGNVILSGKISDTRIFKLGDRTQTKTVLRVVDESGALRSCEELTQELDVLAKIDATFREVLLQHRGDPTIAAELPSAESFSETRLIREKEKLLAFQDRHVQGFLSSPLKDYGKLTLELINLSDSTQDSSTMEFGQSYYRILVSADEGIEMHSDRLDRMRIPAEELRTSTTED